MNPANFYTKQIADHTKLKEKYSSKSNIFATSRLVFFLAAIFIIYLLRNENIVFPVLSAIILLIIFLYLVIKHREINEKKEFEGVIIKLNKDESKRLYGELPEENTGKKYLNRDNLFSKDFDIFGKNSLYHHISRCVLKPSKDLLASFLIELKEKEEVLKRQTIVRELSLNIDWSQAYQAKLIQMAGKVKEQFDFQSLSSTSRGNKTRMLAFILAGISLVISGLYFAGILPFFSLLFIAVVNYGIMIRYQSKIFHLGIKTDVLIKHIQTHLEALQMIHEKDFKSSELKELTQIVNKDTLHQIKSLENTIRWLDSRGNLFYGILNAFLVLDLFTYATLKRWIHRNKSQYNHWFEIVYQLEVFTSMASYTFQHPEFNFPELIDDDYELQTENLGHPLIRKDERVANNFEFGEERLYLVTGSNMSGKSTFLRTVGLNVAMAWIGLPVCADHFKTSKFLVFSSMRTQDDLMENTSSFYAELRRIKLLLSLLENTQIPIIYFLDEILKGTNSEDRHNGAKGIIAKLLDKDCIGFISTHDLMLADEYDTQNDVKNLSFNSKLEKGELLFDYKLYDEKCTTTNASQLMKSMGIID